AGDRTQGAHRLAAAGARRPAPRPGGARRRRPPRRRRAGMLTGVERASELRPGLWRWEAFHPAYQQDVTSVLVETDEDVVLVDPLAPRNGEGGPFWRALDDAVESGRRLTVAVTVSDHARSMPAIAARYPGATVHAAVPASQRS